MENYMGTSYVGVNPRHVCHMHQMFLHIMTLIDQVLTNAANNLDLIAGKTEEGREAYEEVLTSVRKQVRMKTNGMPLNRY